jgi:hypothetical protein
VAEDDSTAGAVGSPDAGATAPVTPKVLLCWPIFQALYPRPFEGFAQMLIAAGRQLGYRFGVKVYERSLLVPAMNNLGDLVIQGGWDAAMLFDDDCFPPHDTIPRLLTRCFDEGHPVVAAAGLMRNYPWTTTAAQSYPEGVSAVESGTGAKVQCAGFTWLDDLPEDLVDVDFCGFPAVIIHRRVFASVPSPWFGDTDDVGAQVTHDTYFCRKAKAAGFPVKVDGSIQCGHLIEAPILTRQNRHATRQILAGGSVS